MASTAKPAEMTPGEAAWKAGLAVLGIDYDLEDIERMNETDPARAAQMIDAYSKAAEKMRRSLRKLEAECDEVSRLTELAKAEGKASIEFLPEFAREHGWKVRGNPRKKLTLTTPSGGTWTVSPLVKPPPAAAKP